MSFHDVTIAKSAFLGRSFSFADRVQYDNRSVVSTAIESFGCGQLQTCVSISQKQSALVAIDSILCKHDI